MCNIEPYSVFELNIPFFRSNQKFMLEEILSQEQLYHFLNSLQISQE